MFSICVSGTCAESHPLTSGSACPPSTLVLSKHPESGLWVANAQNATAGVPVVEQPLLSSACEGVRASLGGFPAARAEAEWGLGVSGGEPQCPAKCFASSQDCEDDLHSLKQVLTPSIHRGSHCATLKYFLFKESECCGLLGESEGGARLSATPPFPFCAASGGSCCRWWAAGPQEGEEALVPKRGVLLRL